MEGACCGQGCVNCVWSVYASEVVKYYSKFHDRLSINLGIDQVILRILVEQTRGVIIILYSQIS
uniref:Oxidoreductase-like domain-containing protein n=1 Tax=Angiostrongylus cantonensis TaxID=6313 RepID=A0A0K0DMW6_ANGCA